MPRIVFNDKNIARGRNFEKVCNLLFPKASREKIGAFLGGVPGNTIKNWESGGTIANRALLELERRGVSLKWLLSSEGAMFSNDRAPNQVEVLDGGDKPTHPKEMPPANASLPVNIDEEKPAQRFRAPANAAALSPGGRRGDSVEDDPEIYDDIVIPETTHFIQIHGDSMEPLVMDRQYVMIGPQYFGEHDQPQNREIVVVHVSIQDDEQAGSDKPWEGVYCKRIQDGGDIWHFTSINPAGESFTAEKANCLVWPVIGVYFAGKGKPPRED